MTVYIEFQSIQIPKRLNYIVLIELEGIKKSLNTYKETIDILKRLLEESVYKYNCVLVLVTSLVYNE